MELSVLGFTWNLPPFEQFRNVDPPVSVSFVRLEQQFLFLLGPGLFVNLWVQLIMPP